MQQWTTTTRGGLRIWASHKCVQVSGRYFWDLYVPGLPSAAFDRSVDRELNRVDPVRPPAGLQTAIIAITTRCALGCEHRGTVK